MKSQRLLRKYRLFCGAICFCFAYLPVVVNVSERKSNVEPHRDSGNNVPSAMPIMASTNAVAAPSPYFSKFTSKSLDSACLAYPQGVSDLQTRVAATQTVAIVQVEKKKIENAAPKNVNIVNVAGQVGSILVKGQIKSNFYVDARALGVPANIVDSVIKNLSPKINFKNALKCGDKFEIVYDKNKEMVYARITTKRTSVAAYRFKNGRDLYYYFENGEKCNVSSSRGANFFGQPLAGRLAVSAKFGMRRHPITGRIHNHSGIDLRAAYGSPVYAIQDGVVKRASMYSGYGRCVDIQHSSGYSSRYAHLSRYAVRYGGFVKKGQVIGYVGSSGMSTGPHLHLELARNNHVVNPFSVKMIPTPKSVVPNRAQFNFVKSQIDRVVSRYR